MKITVYNMKGSAGKTPIATNIALDREYALATNEPYNLLDTILPEERLFSLQPDEEFPDFPEGIDVVFDLAGLIVTRCAAEYSLGGVTVRRSAGTYLQRAQVHPCRDTHHPRAASLQQEHYCRGDKTGEAQR